MSRAAKDRASRLREFKDRDDEYRETGDRNAAIERYRAMRSKDVRESDFHEAQDIIVNRALDEVREGKRAMRDVGMDSWKKEK